MLPKEQRFYEGEPCSKDGTRQRYRRNKGCVSCAKADNAIRKDPEAWRAELARRRQQRAERREAIYLTKEKRAVVAEILAGLGDARNVPLPESRYVVHLPDLGDD